jgi:hypothetical protein
VASWPWVTRTIPIIKDPSVDRLRLTEYVGLAARR